MPMSGFFSPHCTRGKQLGDRGMEPKIHRRTRSLEQGGYIWYCPGNGFKTRVSSEEASDDIKSRITTDGNCPTETSAWYRENSGSNQFIISKYTRVDTGNGSQAELQESRFQSSKRKCSLGILYRRRLTLTDFSLPEVSSPLGWRLWGPLWGQGMLASATRFPHRLSEQVTVRWDPERFHPAPCPQVSFHSRMLF